MVEPTSVGVIRALAGTVNPADLRVLSKTVYESEVRVEL